MPISRVGSDGAGRPVARAVGFTLIELLVVLALMGLILSIVPPLVSAAFPGVELKSAARTTVASLRQAREEAIRTGRDAALAVDLVERSLKIDGGYRPVRLPSRMRIRLETAETEMQDERTGAIRFFPDGSSTGGVILLERGNQGYQVGVNWLTGQVRMAPRDDP
ncbi:GspH/FimT family pseudopilin [Thioalkalicoccus limnaeus]|uniref:Type II secretion system protein H n=1 Tax=Thioalkalicoccus limnaeus TaxID=120681 RepID=A0ABV4BE26_9GAMM